MDGSEDAALIAAGSLDDADDSELHRAGIVSGAGGVAPSKSMLTLSNGRVLSTMALLEEGEAAGAADAPRACVLACALNSLMSITSSDGSLWCPKLCGPSARERDACIGVLVCAPICGERSEGGAGGSTAHKRTERGHPDRDAPFANDRIDSGRSALRSTRGAAAVACAVACAIATALRPAVLCACVAVRGLAITLRRGELDAVADAHRGGVKRGQRGGCEPE